MKQDQLNFQIEKSLYKKSPPEHLVTIKMSQGFANLDLTNDNALNMLSERSYEGGTENFTETVRLTLED